ncbi:hypothetical protein KJ652_01900 [Patescibacteria group bacterium]|nr:hypothetical protein [Patescibacteria group bacterium]MBU1123318.1 hypothetical protein [Patescibacteria group bacterium]MBU1911483.1 hypothetical protein [Patescibacteria group bacterium]
MTSKKSLLAKSILTVLTAVIIAPITAHAYLLPEDVLMGNDTYVPPSNRDSRDRVLQQSADSAERRQAEWEVEYEKQHPTPPPVEEEIYLESEGNPVDLSGNDIDLLRTIRLLNRIDQNQATISHSGAPPLAPTGAPAILSALTMLGAVTWTMKRAGGKKCYTK